jgi:hypothetical protein
MESPRDLLHFGRNPGHSCHQPGDPRLEWLQFGRHARFGGTQLKTQRNQPLLGAVVQVAFYAAARIIGRRDDTGARGEQLVARGRVGDRGHDQVGEVRHPRLGVGG